MAAPTGTDLYIVHNYKSLRMGARVYNTRDAELGLNSGSRLVLFERNLCLFSEFGTSHAYFFSHMLSYNIIQGRPS